MKCFYHQTSFAIGSCKNCGKGLCKKCAVDLSDGLACRHRCEEKVKDVIAMIERGKNTHTKASKIYRDQAIWLVVMGVILVGVGYYLRLMVMDLMAGGFFIGAFFAFLASKRFNKK